MAKRSARQYSVWHTSPVPDKSKSQTQAGGQQKKAFARRAELVTPDPEHKVSARQKEIGGRGGPDPTRYGDWEKAGRCIDF
jgi:hypothetical protein